MPLCAIDQKIGNLGRNSPEQLSVEHNGRRQRAISQAIDSLHAETLIFGSRAHLYSQAILNMANHAFAAHRLARLGAAHFQNMSSGESVTEIVVETDNSVYFSVRDVEGVCDQRDSGLVDVTEFVLEGVQNRQEGARQALQVANATKGSLFVPALFVTHSDSPITAYESYTSGLNEHVDTHLTTANSNIHAQTSPQFFGRSHGAEITRTIVSTVEYQEK